VNRKIAEIAGQRLSLSNLEKDLVGVMQCDQGQRPFDAFDCDKILPFPQYEFCQTSLVGPLHHFGQ